MFEKACDPQKTITVEYKKLTEHIVKEKIHEMRRRQEQNIAKLTDAGKGSMLPPLSPIRLWI
jgi:hypothetical protein